jgi:UDP-N-acetylmuramoylalanine--D-glutamate ligase
MIPVTTFAGKRVAVFGLGRSGLATCRALIAGDAEVLAFDDDAAKVMEAARAGIQTADLHQIAWSEVAALVLSPGVPLTHPVPHWSAALARRASVDIIGDIELYCRERAKLSPRSPFVAITGTNGKSTTTALVTHLLKAAGVSAASGGNIGVPILSLDPPAPDCVHVIECSSYQIDLAPNLEPSVGILLNVSPDHIDRHGSLDNYAAIKVRLVTAVPADGTAIIGVDDEWGDSVAGRLDRAGGARVRRVSVQRQLEDGIFVEAGRIIEAARGNAPRMLAEIAGIDSLRGEHNAQNAACAAAAALALGVGAETLQRGLRSFPGLEHRMEQVGRRGRVLFVNDSKATNADAAARALASFSGIFWILGGQAKAGGITELTKYFDRIRKAYLIGDAAGEFAATLDGRVPNERAGTLDRAVDLAARDAAAEPNGTPVVLLSPACASFDQFPNFEIRGARFRELVLALEGVEALGEQRR